MSSSILLRCPNCYLLDGTQEGPHCLSEGLGVSGIPAPQFRVIGVDRQVLCVCKEALAGSDRGLSGRQDGGHGLTTLAEGRRYCMAASAS